MKYIDLDAERVQLIKDASEIFGSFTAQKDEDLFGMSDGMERSQIIETLEFEVLVQIIGDVLTEIDQHLEDNASAILADIEEHDC